MKWRNILPSEPNAEEWMEMMRLLAVGSSVVT